MKRPTAMHILIIALPFALGACGGGGGNAPPPNQPPTASFTATPAGGPPPLTVTFDASASADSDGSISSYQWDFGGGATGAGRTVEHSFSQSAAHTVSLTVTDNRGGTASTSREVLVNAPPTARISADPVGGSAPLTVNFDASASSDEDGAIASYAWSFAGGATGEGAAAAHTFTSPGVYAVRLRVTDDLGGADEVVFEVNVGDGTDVVYTIPYVANGPHADDLRPCLYLDEAEEQSCTLAQLPFIGMERTAPSVDDLMSRVLVSHRWMGDNFKAVLEMLPADLRLLARSLTGIVIASDIRPAHYRPYTGAIYLDADFFWRTAEQLAVVTQEPDYRAAFQSRLQVRLPWRFVYNNQRFGIRRDSNGVRNLDDVALYMGFLLFHELSHAADFAPPSSFGQFRRSETVLDAISSAWPWPSTNLARVHPLRSNLMRGLAAVSFTGEEPTAQQAALLPDDLVETFSTDGAVDYYSYSSQFEDLADLHTAALMSRHFGQEQDTGITDNPDDDETPLTVAWGQRGRMTASTVIARTRWVVEALYPGDVHELDSYLIGRPAPLPMRRGDSWTNNIVLDGGADFSSQAPPTTGAEPQRQAAAPPRNPTARTPPRSFLGCIRIDPALPEAFKHRLGL